MQQLCLLEDLLSYLPNYLHLYPNTVIQCIHTCMYCIYGQSDSVIIAFLSVNEGLNWDSMYICTVHTQSLCGISGIGLPVTSRQSYVIAPHIATLYLLILGGLEIELNCDFSSCFLRACGGRYLVCMYYTHCKCWSG